MSETKSAPPELSKMEGVKAASAGLAGGIAESLASGAATFDEGDAGLLKHHGSYQQDDRDLRAERRKSGEDKAWIYMVRTKVPGGRMTPEQYLVEDEVAREWGYGSVRVTSRQGLQLHGIGRENLKNTIKTLNSVRATTLGACGDVNRNVMACPVSDLDWRAGLGFEKLADELAERFAPRSTAYWEIWCDGEKWGEPVTPSREEPIYGKTYLPRKFKMAVAVPEDNCVDLYTQDLGIEVVHDGKRTLAYDLIVGGGMGFNHSKTETYARLGSRLVRANPAEVLDVVEEIVKIQRDHGGRADRNHARLKYLLDDNGVDWFKEELFRRLGRELPDAGPQPEYKIDDHLGWDEAPDGTLFVGIPIENGRIQDTDDAKLMTGLREIVSRHRPDIRFTPLQNVVFAGIAPGDRAAIERLLHDHGIPQVEKIAKIRRRAMACPALPTCGLALAESERVSPALLDRLVELGSGDVQIELRWTGCPNSCVRTPTAEIGIAGRGPKKYVLYLGGSHQGTRLAYKFRETVDHADLPGLIHESIRAWKRGAKAGESFGDWSDRLGAEGVEAALAEAGA